MILKEQEILKFDVVDIENMVIPSEVKINNLKSEYDLTYDFKSKVVGKVKNIKVSKEKIIADIIITDFDVKLKIKDFVFRPALEFTGIKSNDGKRVVQDLSLMYVSMIQKEKDIYE